MYRRDDVAATVRWYIMDGLGSVVGEVDPSGNLTCSRGFDVYGATRSQTGTPTSKHGFVGKLGHETEDASGLIYERARWYDAAAGRFVREDPGRNGSNWLVYADDDPCGRVDRTEMAGEDPKTLNELLIMFFELCESPNPAAIFTKGVAGSVTYICNHGLLRLIARASSAADRYYAAKALTTGADDAPEALEIVETEVEEKVALEQVETAGRLGGEKVVAGDAVESVT